MTTKLKLEDPTVRHFHYSVRFNPFTRRWEVLEHLPVAGYVEAIEEFITEGEAIYYANISNELIDKLLIRSETKRRIYNQPELLLTAA